MTTLKPHEYATLKCTDCGAVSVEVGEENKLVTVPEECEWCHGPMESICIAPENERQELDLDEMCKMLGPVVKTMHRNPCNGQVFMDFYAKAERLLINHAFQISEWLEELRKKRSNDNT